MGENIDGQASAQQAGFPDVTRKVRPAMEDVRASGTCRGLRKPERAFKVTRNIGPILQGLAFSKLTRQHLRCRPLPR